MAQVQESESRTATPGDLSIVQSFLNSVDLEEGREDFGTPSGLVAWIAGHGLAEPGYVPSEGDRLRAIEVREGIRDLLLPHGGDDVPKGTASRLNEAFGTVLLTPVFAEDDGLRLQPAGTGLDAVFGRLLQIIYASSIEGTWQRLKVCRNDACRWAFYDASKNRSGVWCTMASCGSKMKARSYRRRVRSSSRSP
ncbi:MAG TPA: CGNR zinc finger domain-containing protein [Thermomicrobiales bacterium]|nr:CGNR zinc finger domain-containing protein [Thermomicrobiales bacterium]